MTKKTIILVLIFLIVINTIYWLYVSIRVFKYDEWVRMQNMRSEEWRYYYEKLPKKKSGGSFRDEKGKIDLDQFAIDVDNLTAKQKEEYQIMQKTFDKLDKEWVRSKSGFTNKMISTFAESDLYTTPLLILAVTDAVLIAISFMIILLYKKD